MDGGLTRRDGMWHGVQLETGLGSSNIISQWSLSLCIHFNGETMMGWKCSKKQTWSSSVKTVQLFPLIFRMRSILASDCHSLHNGSQRS